MTTPSLTPWAKDIASGVVLDPQHPVVMAGPCMLESLELGLEVGTFLQTACRSLNIPYVFKSSFDKANRTSVKGVRGPGLNQGLAWLQEIRQKLGVPILTDIHTAIQATEAQDVVDILQIPAFLCTQKDLLKAAAETGKVVQIKKGQWVSAETMIESARYVEACGNPRVILVERGTLFGYNNLVVDFRNLVDMGAAGHSVVYDATHAVQLPGAKNGQSSGRREMVQPLTRAALGMGVIGGVFMEVHPNPTQALSDADTQLDFELALEILNDIGSLIR